MDSIPTAFDPLGSLTSWKKDYVQDGLILWVDVKSDSKANGELHDVLTGRPIQLQNVLIASDCVYTPHDYVYTDPSTNAGLLVPDWYERPSRGSCESVFSVPADTQTDLIYQAHTNMLVSTGDYLSPAIRFRNTGDGVVEATSTEPGSITASGPQLPISDYFYQPLTFYTPFDRWTLYINGQRRQDVVTRASGVASNSGLLVYTRAPLCRVYSLRAYNRVLTPAEIAQNYLADKKRFNLQ